MHSFCIYFSNCSDIFDLPLPRLWTAVLGEHNRELESGHEKRIPIEKIITHSHYSHFDHDLGKSKKKKNIKRNLLQFSYLFYFINYFTHIYIIIVLLKLSDNVKLDKFINKICLPLQNEYTYLMDDNIRNNIIQDRQYSLKR